MCITTQYKLSMITITLKKTIHSTVNFCTIYKYDYLAKKKTVYGIFLYSLQQHVIYTVLYPVCCRANDSMGSTFTIEAKRACTGTEEGFSFLPDK